MSIITVAWGTISMATMFIQGNSSFYALRLLLGITEAGFFPGVILYLTYWFPRSYLARVTAQFLIALPLSFVIGGPLSSFILAMNGMLGLHGWQWLFLVEGMPAFFTAFAALKFLPDGPQHASWLTDTGMLIGYARVSTEDQTLEVQREALRAAGCERIYEEKVSGAFRARPELDLDPLATEYLAFGAP